MLVTHFTNVNPLPLSALLHLIVRVTSDIEEVIWLAFKGFVGRSDASDAQKSNFNQEDTVR